MAIGIVFCAVFVGEYTAYRLTRFWCRGSAFFLGVKYTIQGTENIDPTQSYVVTPNHQSHTDIPPLMMGLPIKFRWVVKKELLRIPFFGWALDATGAIGLDRRNTDQSIKNLRAAYAKLTDGWSVLIYPEGTRTLDGLLQPFKKGAFIIAVETGLPILPITNNGAYKVLPRGTLALTPGCVQVIVGKPIPTKGLTRDDVPALMEETRRRIESDFNPDYDPF